MTGKVLVKVDPMYFRPLEVNYLLGDSSSAKKKLGWRAKMQFEDIVKLMVRSEFDE